MPELYYSYVNMRGNGGKGRVEKKNKVIFSTTNLVHGYMTACKHKNGRDWWIIQMERDTNIYFKVLLTPDTIMVVDSQSIGPKFTLRSNPGQAVFSPDGSKYILYNPANECLIYDFDRETGYLSNLQQVEVQDSGGFYGVAVSPNSRFLYLSAYADLYQIDLREEDYQSSLSHIAHSDGFKDPYFVSGFSWAQLAPDCKIYIVSGTTNNHLHVINKPDLKGKACDFRQHSFYLPWRNNNFAIPNFPHFRIDEEEVCDSTITSVFGDYVYYRRDLEVYPNPSRGIFNIRIPDGIGESNMVVTNIQGQILKTYKISGILPEKRINITGLPTGRYNIEIYPVKNPKRIFYGTQVVKVE